MRYRGSGMSTRTVAEQFEERLAPLLGRSLAATAVRTYCRQALGIEPEDLGPADVSRLADALRAPLRTLLGATAAERVLHAIVQEVR